MADLRELRLAQARQRQADRSAMEAEQQHRMEHDAEQYRLLMARQLLIEGGFVEDENGNWHPAEESGDPR